MSDPIQTYDARFYEGQRDGSYRSAQVLLARLAEVWTPGSVVDLGCGQGTWLRAWLELGVGQAVGLDGPWVDPAAMVDPRIAFMPADLARPVELGKRFDLAMSVEVAEHLPWGAADTFALSLVGLADAVLFGAAYRGQPGDHHVNTRPHSEWCAQFLSAGFEVYDLFRPAFWGDERVEPWYQQNTFLYVRPGHPLAAALAAAGHRPMGNWRFVDAVHPFLFEYYRERAVTSGGAAADLTWKPNDGPQAPEG